MKHSALIVMAKAPRPGFSKTRLCPPLSHDVAAEVAAAALLDTFDAVLGCSATRKVVAFEGDAEKWVPEGFESIGQRSGTLDQRLAGAFEDVACPGVIIAMDTPQVTPRLLDDALTSISRADTSLGPTVDGGYWYIGLRDPFVDVITGVPMSVPETFAVQERRIQQAGLTLATGPSLRDVDEWDDALTVGASMAPSSRFSQLVSRIQETG